MGVPNVAKGPQVHPLQPGQAHLAESPTDGPGLFKVGTRSAGAAPSLPESAQDEAALLPGEEDFPQELVAVPGGRGGVRQGREKVVEAGVVQETVGPSKICTERLPERSRAQNGLSSVIAFLSRRHLSAESVMSALAVRTSIDR